MQDFIPFFQGEKRIITERLADYFDQHGLNTKINYDEAMDAYILSIPADKEKEAKKYYQEFYFKEWDRVEKEEKNKLFSNETYETNIPEITPSDEILSAGKLYSDRVYYAETAEHGDDAQNIGEEEHNGDIQIESSYGTENYAELNRNNHYAYSDNTDSDSEHTGTLSNKNNTDKDYAEQIDTDAKSDYIEPAEFIENSHNGDNNNKAGKTDNKKIDGANIDDEKNTLKSLLSGSSTYEFKSEKYKNYTESAYVFLAVGIGGIIFTVLNIVNVLHIFNGFFPIFMSVILFAVFIYIGLISFKKAKRLKKEADEENRLTEKINEWLKNTITREFLDSLGNNEASEELDYIRKVDTIRSMLIKEFGDINPDYLDRLIDEYYNKNFD